MKTTEPTETHALTVREIGRLVGEFNSRRRGYTEELAFLFSAAESGQPEPLPATQRSEQVRGRALEMLNGYSPDNIKHPSPISRKSQLENRRRCLRSGAGNTLDEGIDCQIRRGRGLSS
jgi:hypothetical protein